MKSDERGIQGRMKHSIVLNKSYVFALRAIRVARLVRARGEFDLGRQILGSATSVGANIEEARAGSSRADFANKMTIASKEAREAHYWLRLLRDARIVSADEIGEEIRLADELVRLLTSIVKTVNLNSKPKNSKPKTQN